MSVIDASSATSQLMVWVLTDGKIGDDVQCLAVARALAPQFEKRVICPRPFWSMLAPWGPIDPQDRPDRDESPIAPTFPDIVIASGRRAIPYARTVKRASGGRTFVAIMKDPRINPRHADLIWAPAHDRVEGENVFKTLTSPHGLSEKLAASRSALKGAIADLPQPFLGVVLGGPSGGAKYDAEAASDLIRQIGEARRNFASLAITPSRRTPADVMEMVRAAFSGSGVFIWDGEGDNPYVDILANASALIVAADSHNMMSEAAATGTGIYAWRPPGLAAKLSWFVDQLEAKDVVRPLKAEVESFSCAPIDATAEIVAGIKARLGD